MTEYRINIVVDGKDNASHALGGIGGALSRIGEIGAGIIGADIFRRVATGFTGMASAAVQATADFQAMEIGISSLLARELVAASATDAMTAPTLAMGDALEQATPKAQALMKELADIAVLSPFRAETVNQTFRTAMAFGYASDEATQYTRAILNVAAGTGATNDMLQRMGYNFAQIRMQGRVTAVDVRQLAMAGFDLNGVLRYMGREIGTTINGYEDFNKALASGKINWKQFTDLFEKYADENFGGASERAARTLNGLKSTFADVFQLSMPKILGPSVEKFTVFANRILDKFMEIRDSGALEAAGEKIGMFTDRVLNRLDRVFNYFSNIKGAIDDAGWFSAEFVEAVTAGLDQATQDKIYDVWNSVTENVKTGLGNLRAFWDENGGPIKESFAQIGDAFKGIYDLITGGQGIDPGEVIKGIGQAFEDGTLWIKDNGPAIASSIQAVADAITSMGNWIAENKDTVLSFMIGFGASIVYFQAAAAVPGILAGISAGLTGLGAAAATAAPIALAAVAIGLVVTGLTSYGEAVLGADAANATFFQKMSAGFWGILNDASNTVNMIGQIISTVWNQAWENAKLVFATAVLAITVKIAELKGAVGDKIAEVAAIVQEKIGPLADVFNTVKDAVMGLIGFIVELATKLAGMRIPPFLTRHSPSPIEQAFGNWNEYAKDLAINLPRVKSGLDMPTPAFLAGNGAVDQRQYNYNLGVTTSEGSDVVTRNFAVMQVLANGS